MKKVVLFLVNYVTFAKIAYKQLHLLGIQKLSKMNFLALILASLTAAKETLVNIEGKPTLEKWNAILKEHDVVVAGYSYCFFAK